MLVETCKIVRAVEWKNWTGAAATGDYVSLKNYAWATIIIDVGAFAGGDSVRAQQLVPGYQPELPGAGSAAI